MYRYPLGYRVLFVLAAMLILVMAGTQAFEWAEIAVNGDTQYAPTIVVDLENGPSMPSDLSKGMPVVFFVGETRTSSSSTDQIYRYDVEENADYLLQVTAESTNTEISAYDVTEDTLLVAYAVDTTIKFVTSNGFAVGEINLANQLGESVPITMLRFSPDGEKLLIVVVTDGEWSVNLLQLVNTQVEEIYQASWITSIEWSPEGDQFAVVRTCDKTEEVVTSHYSLDTVSMAGEVSVEKECGSGIHLVWEGNEVHDYYLADVAFPLNDWAGLGWATEYGGSEIRGFYGLHVGGKVVFGSNNQDLSYSQSAEQPLIAWRELPSSEE